MDPLALPAIGVIITGLAGLAVWFRVRAQNLRDRAEAAEREAAAQKSRAEAVKAAAEAVVAEAEAKRKTQESAKVLAEAYGVLIDDLKGDIADARDHVKRQDGELAKLRDELRETIVAKDREIAALRQELANERTESSRLRLRVGDLEAKVLQLSSAGKPA